jgi:hypothetical protein
MNFNYIVDTTPHYDRVGTLGAAVKYRTSLSKLDDVLAELIDLMPVEVQYQLARKLSIPVAELYPQAVGGDRDRAKLLKKLENKYGKIDTQTTKAPK